MKSIVSLLLLALAAAPLAGAAPPNVVIFLADDLGWGDLGVQGHAGIRTPNLDRFAAEGVRFTQGYSACGVCSPSRAAILTGRTPYRNGVYRWIPEGSDIHLRRSEIALPALLKKQGYDTCHAGKWHLNGKFNSPEQPQPGDHGYDHWLATQNNAAPNHLDPRNLVRNGTALGRVAGPSAVIAVTEAADWLKARPDPARPFFLTVWTHEPHLPIESAPEFMQPYAHLADEELRQHHGNVTQLDHAFGRLLRTLDEHKLAENTLIVFTSDNGPEGNGLKGRTRGSTGGLRGRKRDSFEGGIRVPFLVRFPAHFRARGIQPGSVSEVPVIGHDLFATVCAVAGAPLPADRVIDGVNLLPALAGTPLERAQPLYWRNHLAGPDNRVALRDGDWKIIGNEGLDAFLLFNLRQDPREQTDLAAAEPERLAALKARLLAHDAAVRKEGRIEEWSGQREPAKRRSPPG